jgi:hypothetical protein
VIREFVRWVRIIGFRPAARSLWLEAMADYAGFPDHLAEWYEDKPHQVLREMMGRLDEVDPAFRTKWTWPTGDPS